MSFENLTPDEQLFSNAAESFGIPITEEKLKEKFDQIAVDEGVPFANPSDQSPFYRFIKSALAAPALLLIAFVIREIMPSRFVKTAKGVALDMLGWTYDLPRKEKSLMRGKLTFTRSSVNTVVSIPINTWVRTAPINGKVYRVKTTQVGSFGVGQLTTQVNVVAELEGEDFNLAEGYFTILEKSITGIVAVTNSDNWITSPGTDTEPDDDYRLRIRARFSAVSDYHVNSVYKSIIARYSGISYDRIYIDYTVAPRDAGSANAYILFDAGVDSATVLAGINNHIRDQGHHGLGDDMLVLAMPETEHDVELTLYIPSGFTNDDKTKIQNQIEQIIRAAFRENQEYPDVFRVFPNKRFSFQLLGSSIVKRFPELVSIEWNNSDIISNWNIPRLNTLTINIEEV